MFIVFLLGLYPVSYTHLDVYKRQALDSFNCLWPKQTILGLILADDNDNDDAFIYRYFLLRGGGFKYELKFLVRWHLAYFLIL